MKLVDIINDRISLFSTKASSHKRKATSLSWARFFTFVLMVVNFIGYLNMGYQAILLIPLAILLIVFVALIVKHKSEDYQYQINKELMAINEEEIKRSSLDFKDLPDGMEYDEVGHPYTHDLDVFGEHSLFQMINRIPLVNAQKLLANWLKYKSTPSTILARQEAIKELKDKTDWSQHLIATARVITAKEKKKNKGEFGQLFKWLEEPETTKGVALMKVAGYVLAISNVLSLGFVLFGDLPYQYFLLSFVVSMLSLAYSFSKCAALGEQLNQSHMIIKTYYKLIVAIENEDFNSPLLQQLSNVLKEKNASASIKELDRITFRFSSRASMFYGLIDPLFMLDFHILAQAIEWKNKQRGEIKKWFEVVDEVGALTSLGGFYFLNKNYEFPLLADNSFTLIGKEIGHPLIPETIRVSNDFSMTEKGEVGIITGSNMSGKSTFERTVGVNIVLAQMGAPVCASAFELSPMEVFTSMRTKDNLEESTSSFYAELKRIRQLFDHVAAHEETFYVIDEVLKGTNSEDRIKGAISIAKQLAGKNCFGLISTHDLSLSKLADENEAIVNFSFNSTIEGDQIIFDYQLTKGPCKSFNASKLMENMGIIPQEF